MLAVMPPHHSKMGAKRRVLVTGDLDELTGGMTSLSTLCSVVSKGLLATGLFMIARKFWKHYCRWQVCAGHSRRSVPACTAERPRHLIAAHACACSACTSQQCMRARAAPQRAHRLAARPSLRCACRG